MGYPQDFTLADGKIVVGNGSNLAKHVAVSGDVTLANTGATTVTDLTIASEARGDLIRRGASTWERVSAKDSGKVVLGDGTDVISATVSGDASISAAGLLTVSDGDGFVGPRSTKTYLFEDFLGKNLNTTDSTWATKDTSAAGSPTLAIVADGVDGAFKLAFDAQNEAQILTLYWNDEQNIPVGKGPIVTFRLKFDSLDANDTLVFGLASAQNDTADTVATNAWFRVESALALLLESDDTVSDLDDRDPSVNATADTYAEYKIDASTQSNIKFYRRTTLGGTYTELTVGGSTFTWAGSTDKVQPFIQLQKSTGTQTTSVTVDYVKIAWTRT